MQRNGAASALEAVPYEQSVHETLTYYAFPDIHWMNSAPTIRSSGL
jgi:hypothetical protein